MISRARFATQTTERLIARIYSLACAISGVEVLFNAWSQRDLLAPGALFSALGFSFVIIGMVYSAWRNSDSRGWFRVHAIVGLLLIVDWQWQVADTWPQGQHPWVWWAVGNAAISAGIGFRGWRGTLLQVLLPAAWIMIATSESGGSAAPEHAIADAAFVLLLSASISAIIWALRTRARLGDAANLQITAATAEKNRLDAIDREATAAATLIHTKVIAVLEAALDAPEGKPLGNVALQAQQAEQAIDEHMHLTDLDGSAGPLEAWCETVRQAVVLRYPAVEIELRQIDGLNIPAEIAVALTESTLQAIDNSVRHAGPKAATKLKIEGLTAGVKVVVSDQGRGFWVRRNTRGQVGITRSIFERCESVGVTANIDSQPGKGCRVSLQWVDA